MTTAALLDLERPPVASSSSRPFAPARCSTRRDTSLSSQLSLSASAALRSGNTRPRVRDHDLRPRRALHDPFPQVTSGATACRATKRLRATVFTQTDPLEADIGSPYPSTYVYGNNNPTVYVDPSGLRGMPNELAQRSANPILPNRAELDPGELKHQKAIEKWARFNGLNPLLLGALTYHEGGEYIGSAGRRQVAKRADRYSSSKGMMQIQNGTAKQVLDEIYNEDPPKHLDRKLINDDDYSLKVAAGYLRLLRDTYGVTGDRELFLAYSARPNTIRAMKETGFDPMGLSTDGTRRTSTIVVGDDARKNLIRRNDVFWPAAVEAVRKRVA